MAKETAIQWTDKTFNAWRGCSKIAPECKHCYADTMSKRNPKALAIWGNDGTRVVAAESYWRMPLAWDKEARRLKRRFKVFALSFGDVFEEWSGGMLTTSGSTAFVCHRCGRFQGRECLPNSRLGDDAGECGLRGCDGSLRDLTMNDVRRRLFHVIDSTPNLDWQLLTKRPENVRRMYPVACPDLGNGPRYHRPNVWLGTTAGTQETAEKNVSELMTLGDLAELLFVSAEPLLEQVRFRNLAVKTAAGTITVDALTGRMVDDHGKKIKGLKPLTPISWMIVGGESGSKESRPMHPDWIRLIRDDCQATETAFFFKQWGDWKIGGADGVIRERGLVGRPVYRRSMYLDVQGKERSTSELNSFNLPKDWARMTKVAKKTAGRILDGKTWSEFPR